YGSGDGQFSYPQGIAVDSSGNVYVADTNNNRIEKFDSSGTYVTKWGSYGSGDGQFQYPQGVAVDSSGNVYVLDSSNNRIQKFDSSGTYVTKWGSYGSGDGQFRYPQVIAVDSSGNVYVEDYNNRIQKFDSSGTYVTQWGSDGSGDGQFSYPQGIAVDSSGNVYVADTNNNRIEKFDSSGTYVTKWGSYGSSFIDPSFSATDSSGNVYVADTRNNRIEKFDSSGTYVTKWGSYGSGDGQFQNPQGIAVDSSGNVYVVDSDNNRIEKFDSSGTYVTKWGSNGSGDGQFQYPQGIAVDSSGNVYVADCNNNRIEKFDSNGTYVTKWGSNGSGDGQFQYPQGIAVDSSENVYVADSDNDRIQKFDSNGAYLTQWGSNGSGDGQFQYPQGIAVDSSENVYVADSDNDRIQKFDSNGAYLTQWGSNGSGDGQFQYPQGIAVDSSENVYVADSDNDRIQKFDSNGAYLTQWGSSNPGDVQFVYPYGVTVDSSGNMYVLDENYDTEDDQIRKFSPNNNAPVTGLTLSAGTLSPSFTSNITSYTASVATSVDTVTVTPMLGDPTATVNVSVASGTVTSTVNNNVTSYSVPLNVGANPIQIVVTALDGTSKTYTVTVTRGEPAASSNADLSGLTLSSGTLSPVFASGTTTYTSSVANGVSSLIATANVYDSNATMTVNGAAVASGQASGAINLSVGSNPITIVVTAQNGTSKTYTVTVTRAQAPSSGGGGGGGGSITPPTPSNDKVTSTDGKLTLPIGKTGKVSLGDAVTITIPADAAGKELKLTIEKLSDTQKLLTKKDVLASPIYEILKNFSENFSKPVTLTLSFDPASLKSNQKASVFYYDEAKKSWIEVGGKVNGNHVTVEVNHFTKYAVFAVGQAADMPITDHPTDTKTEVNFSDISRHWAEANIKQAVSSGIVSGYPDGTFKPNSTVTRAEFAVMLMNTLKPQGEGAALTFTDTAKISVWAQKAVAQAVHAGIINGYEDGTFRPDAEITRPEMAAMIANALGQSIKEDTATGFADDKDIPAWAKGAVAAMKKLGIIEGKGTNEFAPGDKTTRAEAVTVLLKMLAHKSK
ncbi:DNA-binding beta-propeller fold protein YncE, partial [Aneurinibacillus soli]|uniref:S-layer homology domain-containing protein n=1 Tax=Aneurinibacillus soli TaxID=1500254 RepID=UPI000D7BCD25